MENSLVSVIITTKNSSAFIENCVRSIKNQTYKNIEIIVVDNFSEDDTYQKASDLNCQVFAKGPERSAQRNYGAEMAKGSICGFIDVDMTLDENVISEVVELLKNNNISALYVPENIYGASFINRVRNFERSFYNKTVIDGSRFFRVCDFLSIEGYDINLNGTEDWDLDRKIKQAFANSTIEITKSPLHHHENNNLKEYLFKKSYYASNFDNYFKKWGNDKTSRKQFGLFYRYFLVFIENGKWKKLIAHPIYAFSMYFLRFLVGVVFILSKLNISKKKSVYTKK